MKYQKKISVLIILIFISSIMSTANAQTQGWGIGPSIIQIPNGLKNATYQQTIKIYNENNYDSIILLNSSGDIKNWISFFEFTNTTQQINITSVNKTSTKDIMLQISIPIYTANGEYNGTIVATPKQIPSNISEGDVIVEINLPIILTIMVTGDQDLNVSVERIVMEDTEIYYNARILVDFINMGNVVASPIVEVEFSKDGQNVGNLSSRDYIFIPIQPSATKTYMMDWNTSAAGLLRTGQYKAHFSIILGDEIVKQQDVTFEVFKPGTLLRNGTLKEISYQGELEKGETLKIFATFLNSGEVDLIAKFFGDIYRDGELIDTIESLNTKVPKYDRLNLESELTIVEDGVYVIRGRVQYSDEIYPDEWYSDPLARKFTIGEGTSSFDLSLILIVFSLLFVIAIGLFIFLRKKQVIAVNKPRSLRMDLFSSRSKKQRVTKKVDKVLKKSRADKKIRVKKPKMLKSVKPKRRKHIRLKLNKEKSPLKLLHKDQNVKKPRGKGGKTKKTKTKKL